jgi:hypothetical protein
VHHGDRLECLGLSRNDLVPFGDVRPRAVHRRGLLEPADLEPNGVLRRLRAGHRGPDEAHVRAGLLFREIVRVADAVRVSDVVQVDQRRDEPSVPEGVDGVGELRDDERDVEPRPINPGQDPDGRKRVVLTARK